METIIKHTREVGTSAGVLLPRKWLNKQVSVTLIPSSIEEIAKDIFSILFRNKLNEETKGIYLTGSYARGDYDSTSDVDVLVITEKTNRLITQDNYEIFLISEGNFAKNLPNSLYYTSMLREAKTLINKGLIDQYARQGYGLNIKALLKEIGQVLDINRESVKICEKKKENIPDGIIYSIILRLRELYLIRCILSDKSFSRDEFIKICGEKAYSAYIRVKKGGEELDDISSKEITELLSKTEKWPKELKSWKKESSPLKGK